MGDRGGAFGHGHTHIIIWYEVKALMVNYSTGGSHVYLSYCNRGGIFK